MAERVPVIPPGHKVSKYPWDRWFDGSVWKLTLGLGGDVETSATTFRTLANVTAKKRGLRVTVVKRNGNLYLQTRGKL